MIATTQNTDPFRPTQLRPARSAIGRGRPFAAEIVEALRQLVEGTLLPMRVIAAQVGLSRQTVNKFAAKHGWQRPRPARVALKGQRGGGARIVPEVVAAARELVEGTTLTSAAIAKRLGVSPTSMSRWRKRGRWRRPAEAERGGSPFRPPRYPRRRGRPYAADGVGAVRDLVTRTLLSQKAIARQVGISQAQVSVWMRKHGWQRPTPRPSGGLGLARFGAPAADTSGGSARFAAARRTGPLEQEGDRRGRPYAAASRAEARSLWELTRLSTRMIGSRVGAHPGTVARWAKEESWTRPPGRAGREQLRGFFGSGAGRGA